ncbi:MAG: hypothetical protein CUN49_08275 [Candidatus Thermofonsia Clade 1 bacterium]|jgi:hypothetical protein|uniref:Asl1-like glycosyl hydrolase catalytic domain-containing protein n=1 Tax=Candidatus Thermofonsia Clade 1 bacterium TaxID=2364210 RepID=A0A2M8PED8_9CHLR|nr:MAG: hypothetical protein CUN49_08275 [Candidatus Thermofonsia Clade 1 bacterium]
MALRQYRCLVNSLNIRSQPFTQAAFRTGQTLRRHQVITVEDSRRAESEGYLWLNFERGWCAARSLDGRAVFMTDAVPQRERLLGINIDPNNPTANPTPEQLRGLGWVRFVLHMDSRREPPERAFAFYDPIIRAYHHSGTRILLILLQDTFVGNMPWVNGDWARYARDFAVRASAIAARYRGQVAAYQIWNEGDLDGAPTSHYVKPEDYATLLLLASEAINQADPSALVISGGLASDAANSIEYMRAVRRALGNALPVDGIAVHPYGHIPPSPNAAPFPNYTGSLDALMRRFTDAFPDKPIWITEIGVARVDVNNQTYWPRIANYMDKTIDFLRDTYMHVLGAVIWFAWSDSMDQAGIVNVRGEPKNPIFSTFFANLHADYPIYERQNTPFANSIALAHSATDALADASAEAFAARLQAAAPNVSALLLWCSNGTAWLGGTGALAVHSAADLSRIAKSLVKARVRLHAWHGLHGADITAEISQIVQAALAQGVCSIVLDLDPQRLALRQPDHIRTFMTALRRALPAETRIGLSFDGRPANFSAVNLTEWLPFIDSWHPKVWYADWNGRPSVLIGQTLSALRPYRKPIVVLTQFGPDGDMREAGRAALEPHQAAAGIAFWRLGTASAAQLAAVRGVAMPWLAGYTPLDTLGTVAVRTASPLRIRAVPSEQSPTLGQLQPNEAVSVLERLSLPPLEWIRHRRGWSVARNAATGEVYLG